MSIPGTTLTFQPQLESRRFNRSSLKSRAKTVFFLFFAFGWAAHGRFAFAGPKGKAPLKSVKKSSKDHEKVMLLCQALALSAANTSRDPHHCRIPKMAGKRTHMFQ
jgi:hypothetical protein